LIWNTIQCYLKAAPKRIKFEIARAKYRNFPTGIKLVRGAYMHLERQLSEENGYEDPVNVSYDAT